ncbi:MULTISPECIES: MerR family transcriptional regulator [Streptomyces]|uniref:MerR family transcriptional regulator n=1 Tax=Streptomyces virginiae TaxID=1961 RepID=A0ABZ1T8E7_STRVG|nr:MerR family transcriptional regulator [Streptomyces virginiae]WTB21445.1 MerR family transcriptional regulator [Streptomyces virginiae]
MADQAPEPMLTVDELAARAGVTVRTVRFYSTRGLLPPPVIGPRRVGHYGPEHLSRLALIEELQHQGMTLSAIERYLDALPDDLSAHDLAIHRAMVSSWAPDAAQEVSREELEKRAGRSLSDTDVRRLTAMNVLAAAGDGFRVDVGLLRLGVALLDVPIAHETILAARGVLVEHTRSAAHELTALFRDEVWGPFTEGESDPERVESMKALSAHMQPMVVQALVTAFQRSLREELRAAFVSGEAPGGP